MTMIRKSALLEVGKWAEWCICEDSELGLRLYEAGYDSVLCEGFVWSRVDARHHVRLYDATFSLASTVQCKLSRAIGAVFCHKKITLTAAQRYYFIAGWLPWFSDALALLFTTASLILTGIILSDPIHSELPANVFLLPTVGLFTF